MTTLPNILTQAFVCFENLSFERVIERLHMSEITGIIVLQWSCMYASQRIGLWLSVPRDNDSRGETAGLVGSSLSIDKARAPTMYPLTAFQGCHRCDYQPKHSLYSVFTTD